MMRCCSWTWLATVGFAGAAVLLGLSTVETQAQENQPQSETTTLGGLPVWDDGFAEMCYYDAETTIYGQPRKYTRVHILVREWFDPQAGIKTDDITAPTALPVFKLNVCEEIPTENYQYRLMRTLIADRYTLAPQKLAASSQEWCGTSYKHLRWTGPNPGYRSFSYFEGEADQEWPLPQDAVPFETLLLKARELAAKPGKATLTVLPPMDSTHGVTPKTQTITLQSNNTAPNDLKTPAGTFEVRAVFSKDGMPIKMMIETKPPHRLVQYEFGANRRGVLRAVERRAYWDRGWPSKAHPVNQAP